MRRTLAFLGAFLLALPAWAGNVVVDWQYDYVNVRERPGTDKTLVGRLSTGAEAEVLERRTEQGEEWVRVQYTGGEGGVVARSLSAVSEPTTEVVLPTAGDPPAETRAPDSASATAQESTSEEVAPRPEPPAPEPQAPEDTGAREEGSDGYLARYAERPDLPELDATSGVVNMVSGLLLVLALFAGAVFVYRRYLGPRLPSGRAGAGIQILASRSTGQRQGLLLVEAGGLVWLVAQGPEGLRLIAEIRDPEALARLDERYGFLASAFETELRQRMDLETRPTERDGETTAEKRAAEPSPEERLAALRRRPNPERPA